LLFLAALTAILLRHPDVRFYEIDRVAFIVLVVGVTARAVVRREKLFSFERASWPMLGIMLLMLAGIARQPFEHETWSLLASKFIVPFALFHIAGLVFKDEAGLRCFEVYSLMVLGYLSFTAIAFFLGLNSFIFPRFILDASLGAHADRSRGPLLQAAANGVSLNLLALLALQSYRRAKAHKGWIAVLLWCVPIAILATMTRAVWLSFAGTLIALPFVCKRAASRGLYVAVGSLAIAAIAGSMSSSRLAGELSDRLKENGPLEFRQAVYAGAWNMFVQRPFMGWGFHQMPDELPRHVNGYNREKVLYPHNTYLELLAENGVVGFALYVWLMWELWSLRRVAVPLREKNGFLNLDLHRLWPIILAVYWFNAAAVVMSYQFVNALVFTVAGMLAAQRRRAEMVSAC
jgi:O-antigen ligase